MLHEPQGDQQAVPPAIHLDTLPQQGRLHRCKTTLAAHTLATMRTESNKAKGSWIPCHSRDGCTRITQQWQHTHWPLCALKAAAKPVIIKIMTWESQATSRRASTFTEDKGSDGQRPSCPCTQPMKPYQSRPAGPSKSEMDAGTNPLPETTTASHYAILACTVLLNPSQGSHKWEQDCFRGVTQRSSRHTPAGTTSNTPHTGHTGHPWCRPAPEPLKKTASPHSLQMAD